jgi:hypothetical protein
MTAMCRQAKRCIKKMTDRPFDRLFMHAYMQQMLIEPLRSRNHSDCSLQSVQLPGGKYRVENGRNLFQFKFLSNFIRGAKK